MAAVLLCLHTGLRLGELCSLRHIFATNCAENGMDVKMLCELMGHSNVKVTLNRHAHPIMDSKRRQIEFLSDFYGQIRGQICGQLA